MKENIYKNKDCQLDNIVRIKVPIIKTNGMKNIPQDNIKTLKPMINT